MAVINAVTSNGKGKNGSLICHCNVCVCFINYQSWSRLQGPILLTSQNATRIQLYLVKDIDTSYHRPML